MTEALHLLSIREVAERLGVGRSTVYTYISRGLLRPVSVGGGDTRVRSDDVERLIEASTRTVRRTA